MLFLSKRMPHRLQVNMLAPTREINVNRTPVCLISNIFFKCVEEEEDSEKKRKKKNKTEDQTEGQ